MNQHDAPGDTAPEGVGAAQAAPTPEEAERLRDSAYAVFSEADELLAGANLDLIRSALIYRVIAARTDLDLAEQQQAEVQSELARATAAFDPKAGELKWVDQQIRSVTVDEAAPVRKRVDARIKLAALADERERLAPVVAGLAQAVTDAQHQADQFSRETIGHYQRQLAAAEAALANPPMHDYHRLVMDLELVTEPKIVAIRSGVAQLVMQGETTPGSQVLTVLLSQMLGHHLQTIRNQWLQELYDKVDPATKQAVNLALNPPPLPGYEQYGRVTGPGAASEGSVLNVGQTRVDFVQGIPELGQPGRQLPGAQG